MWIPEETPPMNLYSYQIMKNNLHLIKHVLNLWNYKPTNQDCCNLWKLVLMNLNKSTMLSSFVNLLDFISSFSMSYSIIHKAPEWWRNQSGEQYSGLVTWWSCDLCHHQRSVCVYGEGTRGNGLYPCREYTRFVSCFAVFFSLGIN